MSSTLSFDISSVQGNPANARITLTELGDGTIQVAVEVIDGTIADLRGLFFNISDESLVNGLSVAGDDVTGSRFRANRVNSLSLDVNMIGTDTEFDGGVKIGTSGIRRDDIQSTTFILSHDSVDLTLDLFENQDFGVRLTSVNNSIIPGSTSRRGSSKLVGTSDLAPDAVPDTVNTEEDTPVTIDVLGNDDQGDGPATVSVEPGNGPANGTVSVNPDGTIDYTPDPDFFGEDTFTYTITDSDGDTSTAVVTVIVDPNPDAVNDSVTTDEDVPINIDVLANDDIAGEPNTTVTAVGNPSNGTVVINPDGTLTYTPDPNFNGTDNFEYTITDDDGDTSTATVTVTVDPVNDPPDAVNNNYTTNEDTPVSGNVITDDTGEGLDSDPDSDPLTVTGNSDPSNGSVTVNSDGSYTYTPDPNFTGTDSFTYTISDGNGGTDTATVNITVDPVNDPPDAVNNNYTTNEDTPVSGNVITDDTGEGLDSDLDGDTLTVTGNSDPSNGSVTVNSDGSYTYTPDANFNGTDSFTYTISDGNGGTDTATVNITVDPVNDAPNAVNESYTVEANENNGDGFNSSVSGNIIANDTDLDGDTLTATINTNPNNGSVTLDPNGNFTYTPTNGFSGGTDSFTYTISDGNGGTDTATANINIVDPGRQTTTAQGTLGSQTQKIELTTEQQTANSTTFIEGFISTPEFQPPFNIGIVIDVSGSTGATFNGSPVGDVNGDGSSNTILDAEIASTIALIESIIATPGLDNSNVDIGLITFSSNATMEGSFDIADPNNPNVINPTLRNTLLSLRSDGITNFDDALDKSVDFFSGEPDVGNATNLLFFLSDGLPNTGGDGDGEPGTDTFVGNNNPNAINFTSELAALDNLNVQRNAIGVGSGSDISPGFGLDKIDNTGGPEQVLTSDALTGAILANPVLGEVIDFKISVNGELQDGEPGELNIGPSDLVSGPLGYSFGPLVVDGLDPSLGASNEIVATAILDLDGDTNTLTDQVTLTTTNIISGALPTI